MSTSTEESYKEFGEMYFSFIKKDAIKAWKKHKFMTMNLIVPIGSIKFIFTEDFQDYKTIIVGSNNYARLYGIQLRYDLFEKYNPIPTRKDAIEIECMLALELRKKQFNRQNLVTGCWSKYFEDTYRFIGLSITMSKDH